MYVHAMTVIYSYILSLEAALGNMMMVITHMYTLHIASLVCCGQTLSHMQGLI